MRNGNPNTDACANRNTHCHANGYGDTYRHSDSNFNSDRDRYSNCQCHHHTYSDSYGDCNSDADISRVCFGNRLLEES